MKCRYKETMEYFYLTKDNYEEFLKKFDLINYKVEDLTDNSFFCYGTYYFFNRYYVKEYNNGLYKLLLYSKEEFEEIFEVIE